MCFENLAPAFLPHRSSTLAGNAAGRRLPLGKQCKLVRWTSGKQMLVGSFLVWLSLASAGFPSIARAQNPSATELRRELTELKTLLTQAGNLYKQKQFRESVAALERLQQRLSRLPRTTEVARQIQTLERGIERARSLLKLEGFQLTPPPAPGVSFAGEVAPLLATMCGRCHVDDNKGDVQFRSYAELLESPNNVEMILTSNIGDSRLLQVVISGEMPKGNRQLTQTQIELLRRWISEGAKFDGTSSSQNLRTFASEASTQPYSAASTNPTSDNDKVARPTGTESVRFSTQLAPILIGRCLGCHGPNRQAAGLRLDNFTNTIRGGDSGELWQGKNAAESLLVRKLQGTAAGERMPLNMTPLADEQIALFATWIQEGAVFDGGSANQNLAAVYAEQRLASASHEELVRERKGLAYKNWQLALPTIAAKETETAELLVLGNASNRDFTEIVKVAEAAAKDVRRALHLPPNAPLVKGRLSVFVLDKPFDFHEFTKMVEDRSLPPGETAYWRNPHVDAYVVLNPRLQENDEAARNELRQQFMRCAAAMALSQNPQVPAWFAEGVARSIVERQFRRDPIVKDWAVREGAIAAAARDTKDLLPAQIHDETAGLVSLAVVRRLQTNSRAFSQLLREVVAGKPFNEAFVRQFGTTPEAFVEPWLGKRPSGR